MVLIFDLHFMQSFSFIEKLGTATDSKLEQNLRLVLAIAQKVKENRGKALVVGGYPRDLILAQKLSFKIEPKDIDLEVFGIEVEKLRRILCRIGPVSEAGASFSVFKVGDIDIALPRRDVKIGGGHRNFSVTADPNMTFAKAAKRRDFSINAIGLDPLTGEVFDAHNGIEDIKNRTLRATDLGQFGDDPLRVLRAMQFAGRFQFKVEKQTAELCRQLNLSGLSRERIGEEWLKLLLKSEKPSIGLYVGKDLLVYKKIHPEIEALFATPQDLEFHPEGDVGTHTFCVVDAMAKLLLIPHSGYSSTKKAGEDLALMLAALTHDFGKAITTKEIKGVLRSYGHAEAGVELAKQFLKSINMSREIIRRVLSLVADHMTPAFSLNMKEAGVRRLARRLAPSTIFNLVLLSKADQIGKGKPNDNFSREELLLKKAEKLSLADRAPKPVILGRHLIAEGAQPGPELGMALRKLFEAQLAGKFSTVLEGLNYWRKTQK